MRRDLREILLAATLLFLGYAANRLWGTHIGGWRELAALIGGVLFVAMLIILPVALVAAALRRVRGQLAKPG